MKMRLLAAATLALLCALPFVDLGRRSLWPPDEARYGVVVREMVESGDYVLPTLGGKARLDKPPAFVWAGAFASRLLGGVSEVSLRVPSALSAALCLVATFFLGLRFFDAQTGLLAALVLLTSGRFLLYSQWVATDLMLAALMTCAMAAAVAGGRILRGGGRLIHPLLAGQAFMGFAAVAVLTKGPVGIVLPAGVLVLSLLLGALREEGAALRELPRLCIDWALGLPLFAAITAPWYILLAARSGTEAVRYNLFHQNVNRFLDAWNAQQPWHYYLKALPVDLLPWTLFFLAAILTRGGPGAVPRERAAWRFLLCWFAVVFVFFTFATGKSPEYLLPLLPAAALMIARSFTLALPAPVYGAAGGDTGRGSRLTMLRSAAGLLLAASAGGFILIPRAGERAIPGTAGAFALATGLLLLGAAGALAALIRRRPVAAAALLGASVIALKLSAAGALMDTGNTMHGARDVAPELARLREEGYSIVADRYGGNQILFYLGNPVEILSKPARLGSVLERSDRSLLVLRTTHYDEIRPFLPPGAAVLREWGSPGAGYLLVGSADLEGAVDRAVRQGAGE